MKQLNILYIIARPYGDRDVGFQTLARPLIDFATENKWPVRIDLLRPPTFDQLRKVLDENQNFYHIVHFDGHGGAPDSEAKEDGVLVFEDKLISSETLCTLLRQYNIPYMVLNACQSATMGGDPFASVATALLKAGVHGVAAMSYSLRVDGAEVFVPEFYKNLFKEGDISEAMRVGRREMYAKNMREPLYGQAKLVEFNDWIVPVLYHRTTDEKILPKLVKGTGKHESRLPAEARLSRRDFIGRGGAIQKLERATQRQPQAGILIHGMAGEGKTTLAKGFLQWLDDTGGLGEGAIWFSFENIHSASYVIDTLAERLFGLQAMAASQEQKASAIVDALKENKFVMVWDNFESVSGYGGVSSLLSPEDRDILKKLLRDLQDGATKILITSRSPEDWLDIEEVFRLELDGLQGEELWQYCNTVVRYLNLTITRDDPEYKPLIDKLQGNPLSIRVILLRLEKRSARALLNELNSGNFAGKDGDKNTERLLQALAVFNSGLDQSFEPVLRFTGLHEQFVDADYVADMLNEANEPTDSVAACFEMLVRAGLCHEVYENGYRTHPALRASLARLYPAAEAERRAFVDLMGTLCDEYSGKELYEQRGAFELFGANFRNALTMARELDMRDDICALLYGLARYAQNIRHFAEAERLYKEYAQAGEAFGRLQAQAAAYHQLAMVAQERRNFAVAEKWYNLSLEINLKQGDEHGAASTYGQLGNLALERRDFEAAEKWYKQSLEISQRQDDEYTVAITYHQLGRVAQERRDFAAAEKLYKLSLEITLKQGNEYGAANTYHQLGRVAEEREDFAAAEKWYKLSLEILLKQGDEHTAASTYHQLGRIAEKCEDFDTAEAFVQSALDIFKKYNDPHNAEIAERTLHRIQSAKQ